MVFIPLIIPDANKIDIEGNIIPVIKSKALSLKLIFLESKSTILLESPASSDTSL